MADLKPGKYLCGPNGVIHGYNEAMASQPGVRVVVIDAEGDVKDKGALLEPTLHDKLVTVMRDMPLGNLDLMTVAGVPRTDYLSEKVGQVVNAQQRDAAWEQVRPIDTTQDIDQDAA